MYIRRKVFSILVDESGEERLYSVNETLLEDRMFAKKEEEPKKKSGKGKKVALGVTGAVATTAAGAYAAKKGLLGAKAGTAVNKVIMKNTKAGSKYYEQAVKDAVKANTKKLHKESATKAREVFTNPNEGQLKSMFSKAKAKFEAELKQGTPGKK